MATSLKPRNPLSDRKLAELLKLMAHPTRLVILRAVAGGERCVNQLNDLLSISQPSLSQHLHVLRAGGLVHYRRNGRKHCYRLTRKTPVRALVTKLLSA